MNTGNDELMVEILETPGLPELSLIKRDKQYQQVAFTCLSYSPCRRYIALGRSDGTVWLWRPSGAIPRTVPGQVQFNPSFLKTVPNTPPGWTAWHAHTGPVLSLCWVNVEAAKRALKAESTSLHATHNTHAPAPAHAHAQQGARAAKPAAALPSGAALHREASAWRLSGGGPQASYADEIVYFRQRDAAKAQAGRRPLHSSAPTTSSSSSSSSSSTAAAAQSHARPPSTLGILAMDSAQSLGAALDYVDEEWGGVGAGTGAAQPRQDQAYAGGPPSPEANDSSPNAAAEATGTSTGASTGTCSWLLCTGGSDRMIRSWRTDHAAPRLVQLMPGHKASILSLSSHRARLVSASADGTVVVWALIRARVPLVEQWFAPMQLLVPRGAVPLCAALTTGGHGGAVLVGDSSGCISSLLPVTRHIARAAPRMSIHRERRKQQILPKRAFPGKVDPIFAPLQSTSSSSSSPSSSPSSSTSSIAAPHVLLSPTPAPSAADARDAGEHELVRALRASLGPASAGSAARSSMGHRILPPLSAALQAHARGDGALPPHTRDTVAAMPRENEVLGAISGGASTLGGVGKDDDVRQEYVLAHTPLQLHSMPVSSLFLFPSHRLLVSLGLDGVARVCDTASGVVCLSLQNPHGLPYTAAAWLTPLRILVLGDARGYLHACDILSESLLSSVHVTRIHAHTLLQGRAPHAAPLATGALFSTVDATGEAMGAPPVVPIVGLCAKGSMLAVATPTRLYSTRVALGPRPRVLHGHTDTVHAIVATVEPGLVVSVAGDGVVRWWSAETGACAALGESEVAARVLRSAERAKEGGKGRGIDGDGDRPGRHGVSTTGDGRDRRRGNPSVAEVLCVCGVAEGVVATGHEDGSVLVWESDDALSHDRAGVPSGAGTGTGTGAGAGVDGGVGRGRGVEEASWLGPKTKQPRKEDVSVHLGARTGRGGNIGCWRMHVDSVACITAIHSSARAKKNKQADAVITGSYGGLVCVWQLRESGEDARGLGGRPVLCVETGSDVLCVCACARDEDALSRRGVARGRPAADARVLVATGHADGCVRVWDFEGKAQVCCIGVDADVVHALAGAEAASKVKDCALVRLASDGDCIAATTDTGLVLVFSIAAQEVVAVHARHTGEVPGLAICPYTGIVLSADEHGLLLAWAYAERVFVYQRRLPCAFSCIHIGGEVLWLGTRQGPIVCVPLPMEVRKVPLTALPLTGQRTRAEDAYVTSAVNALRASVEAAEAEIAALMQELREDDAQRSRACIAARVDSVKETSIYE